MLILLAIYLVYLLLYGMVSYAIVYHLIRYRVEGDLSRAMLTTYIIASIAVVLITIALLRPV